jgi:hypothetical protein
MKNTGKVKVKKVFYLRFPYIHEDLLRMVPGGKDGRCVRLTILPPSCTDCLEILEPQTTGTLRACPGL